MCSPHVATASVRRPLPTAATATRTRVLGKLARQRHSAATVVTGLASVRPSWPTIHAASSRTAGSRRPTYTTASPSVMVSPKAGRGSRSTATATSSLDATCATRVRRCNERAKAGRNTSHARAMTRLRLLTCRAVDMVRRRVASKVDGKTAKKPLIPLARIFAVKMVGFSTIDTNGAKF